MYLIKGKLVEEFGHYSLKVEKMAMIPKVGKSTIVEPGNYQISEPVDPS